MSNNAPDYENDLVFEPKSADDLNKQERQSDVLISAIEKCEMLEKKLEIAVKAIKTVIKEEGDNIDGGMLMFLTEALAKIKELDK